MKSFEPLNHHYHQHQQVQVGTQTHPHTPFFRFPNLELKAGHRALFTAFSNFDFGLAMVFMKNVLNKNC